MPVMPIPQQMPQQMPVMPQQQQQVIPQFTPEIISAIATPEAQKQFLGENLFPKVQSVDQARAGRIVGMILDAYSTE